MELQTLFIQLFLGGAKDLSRLFFVIWETFRDLHLLVMPEKQIGISRSVAYYKLRTFEVSNWLFSSDPGFFPSIRSALWKSVNFCPRAVSYFTRSKSVRDLSSRKRERLATEKKGSEFGRTSAHQNSDQVYLPVIDSNKAPRFRTENEEVNTPRPNHKSYM